MVDLASSAKDGPPKCPPDPKVLKPIRALRLESRRNAHSYPRRRRHPVKRLDGRAGLARHGRRLRRYMRRRHHGPCNDRVRCNRSRSNAAGRIGSKRGSTAGKRKSKATRLRFTSIICAPRSAAARSKPCGGSDTECGRWTFEFAANPPFRNPSRRDKRDLACRRRLVLVGKPEAI